jgi:hypothetical protein
MRGWTGAVVALGVMASDPAWALDPYMWGVGPRIGTTAIPGRYPWRFPEYVRENGALLRVRTDLLFGVDAVYYASGKSRAGVFGGFGLGRSYFDVHLQFEYDYVVSAGAMDFLVGGGLGFGSMTFQGDAAGSERLVVPYYPVRVESSAQIRDNSRAYQLTLWSQYSIPSNHFYRDYNGFDQDVSGGFYLGVGLELSVMFGDFTPPRPRERRQ